MSTYFFETDSISIVPSITKTADGTAYTALRQTEMVTGVAVIDSDPTVIMFEE